MMSYKQWRMINERKSNIAESFNGSFTLGVRTPQSVGLTGSKMAEMGLHPNPHADNEDPALDDLGDLGGLGGDDAGLGADTGLPNLDDMDLDALLGPGFGSDEGDGDADDANPFAKKDDGDGDEDDDDDDGDEDDANPFAKKGEGDDDEDDDDEDHADDGAKPKFMSSEMPMEPDMKYMSKGHDKCCCKETQDFFSQLATQTRGDVHKKFSGGLDEDFLLPAPEGETEKEPGPGEVGFAPQGRLNQLG